MARDEHHASMKAFRFIDEDYANKEDRLEVRVMPFPKGLGAR